MVGQHIRILKGGRWVHAVDCGDETVLHLVEEAPPPRVRRAYRPEFVAGADAVEVVTHRERTFPPREIVKRAYSRASDPALAQMFRGSEEFVEWCTTGRLAGARNVALDVPGVSPAPSPAPAAASAKAKAKAKRSGRRAAKAVAKTAARTPARRKPPKKRPARAPKAGKAKGPLGRVPEKAPARRIAKKPAAKRTSSARRRRG